jgi:LysM repeat protein
VRPGSRRHADAHVDAEEPVDEHDPLGLFDELGPADEFPGLDDEPEVEVVATGRRSWRDLFRRNARGRPDPLVVRVGAVVLAGLIAVPILASSSGGASTAGAAMIPPTTITAANPAPVTELPPTSATSPASTAARSRTTSTPTTTAAAPSAAPAPSVEQAASAVESAPPCRTTYDIEPGDYWLGIADRAGVDVADLLGANGATSDTPLYPGRSICLPAGAATPVPTVAAATTTAAPTTVKPTTTAAPTTAKSTTTAAKPTTTEPKPTTAEKPTTTTAKPVTTTAKATTTTTEAPTTTQPPRTYTRDEVAQIIRDVWPDDLEDKAIAIATRESNLTPAVRNACCFGLFQIYFSVHAGWLAQMGVTSATQLYDPLVNAQAALALYFRNGGWGPWGG